jgi:hypothetical protein
VFQYINEGGFEIGLNDLWLLSANNGKQNVKCLHVSAFKFVFSEEQKQLDKDYYLLRMKWYKVDRIVLKL